MRGVYKIPYGFVEVDEAVDVIPYFAGLIREVILGEDGLHVDDVDVAVSSLHLVKISISYYFSTEFKYGIVFHKRSIFSFIC